MTKYNSIPLNGRALNLKNKRFGRLIALAPIEQTNQGAVKWLCVCDCGTERTVVCGSLVRGNTRSCGCLRDDAVRKCNTTHGMGNTKIYKIWVSMLSRCRDEKNNRYQNYGGRGIKVCDHWLESIENFYADMGDRPSGLTLDRIDNDGDYTPQNCRWATPKQQARNRRNNRNVTINGQTLCISAWAEKTGIKHHTIYKRLNLGWSEKKAITTPVRGAPMVLSLLFAVFLAGCITEPKWETAENCWRLGLREIPVEYLHESTATVISGLSIDEIDKICGTNRLGCYNPFNDTTYLSWGAGKVTAYHEKCHSIGLTEHNNCFDKGYAMWGDSPETACPDWVLENKAQNDYAKRYHRGFNN